MHGFPAHQQRRKQLREHSMALFEKYQKRYGAPRLTRALKAENVPCCVNTIAKIMQQLQLRARNGRAFRYSQYSHSNVRVSENVLRRQFVATKPNTKWVTGIYLHILLLVHGIGFIGTHFLQRKPSPNNSL